MKKNSKYAAGILCLIIIVGLVAWAGGALTKYGFPPPNFNSAQPNQQTLTTGQIQSYQNGVGRWVLYDTFCNSLTPTTGYTEGTQYQVLYYGQSGGNWIYLGPGSASGATVSLTPSMDGYLWVAVKVLPSESYYVDYNTIKQDNQAIQSYQYIDIDGSGVNSFVFQYNMKGQTIPNSGYPSVTFLGFLIPQGTPKINLLPAQTGTGMTTVQKFYSYYLNFSAANTGVAYYKVEVKINSTSTTDVQLLKLNVPGIGYIDGSLFTLTQTSVDYRYDYTIASSLNGADYLTFAQNTNNRFDSTMELQFTMQSSEKLQITITYFYYSVSGGTATSTALSTNFLASE